jgi:HEAT repeat protein
MLAHSFAMGLATVFFETAASALFLERYGPETLPFVYIAAALLNTATGAVYTGIRGRVGFSWLISGTLLFLLGTTLLLRVGLALSDSAWLLAATLVYYRAVSALTDLEYWATASHMYDVRQSKRLFGFIGSGEVVARIAGSFAVPFLVPVMGVANLLTLSALALGGCLFLAGAVLRGTTAPERAAPAAPGPAKAPAGGWQESRALFRDRYLLLIFGLAFFNVLAKYFVDFAFLAEMKSRHTDAQSLASFFAVFSGATQVLSLLTRVFVSGRLLDRYGVKVGLLVLPIAQLACTALIVGAGLLDARTAVFWLVIGNQGVYKVLKHPIDNPSFKVLYQPLKKDLRLATQIAVETLVTPVTIGIAGGVMLAFSRLVAYDPRTFALVMLANFAGWLVAAARAGGAYAMGLRDALKGRLDEDHAFVLLHDPKTVAALHERLMSENEEDVLASLEILEKADHPSLDPALAALLEHPATAVRRWVLSRFETRRPPGAVRAVTRRLRVEKEPPVRAAAIRCLCRLDGAASADKLMEYLQDENAGIRRAAIIGLLEAGVPAAEERLTALARSTSAVERAWAAQAIGESALPRLHPLLRPLLDDDEVVVRRAAIVAAGRLRAPELWEALGRRLEDERLGGAAARALAAGGASALPVLTEAFARSERPHTRARLARACGRIGGPAGIAWLKGLVEAPDPRVRLQVLRALLACAWRAGRDDAPAVENAVSDEARDATMKLAAWRDLGEGGDSALVREALLGEVASARERLLLLLAFLYDPTAIKRAHDNLRHESRDRRAYALEMLDVTLPAERRSGLMPFFEDLKPEERAERLCAVFPQASLPPEERLADLLGRPPGRTAPWTREAVERALAIAGRTDPKATRRRGMLTIEKVVKLRSVQMFEEASDEILADVASIVSEVEAAPGVPIIRQGEPGDSMYVVVEGRVRVFDGDHTITTLGAGEIFGELALLDPEPRLASVEAEVDTRLLRLDREAFLELMEGNIEVVRGVLHVLCERLRKTQQRG